MTENMKKFLEELSKHEELKERASAVKTKEEVIKLSEELGTAITEEDFPKSEEEMSEEEMNAVAGGGGCSLFGWGECICVFVGTGTSMLCVALGWDNRES